MMSALALLWFAASSRADSITLSGSSIPLANITIQAIQAGKVFYRDTRGARQDRSLDDVRAISFDSLPELDTAERTLAAAPPAPGNANADRGIVLLLRALIKADTDLQRLWINSRLAREHDARGHFTLAAGHLALAMQLSDDVYWKARIPMSSVDEPTYAAANEALDNLQAAARKVKSPELKAALATMAAKVQPLHDRLLGAYSGQPIATGSTLSGLTKREILANDSDAEPTTATKPAIASASTRPARSLAAPEAPTSIEPESPAAIDSLLAKKQFAEALARCTRIQADPGERDLAHFLYQCGAASQGANRPDEAAIAFLRVAILFPQSADAAPSLVNAALIHRDTFHDPAAARRLLLQAAETAAAQNQEAVAQLARELMKDS